MIRNFSFLRRFRTRITRDEAALRAAREIREMECKEPVFYLKHFALPSSLFDDVLRRNERSEGDDISAGPEID